MVLGADLRQFPSQSLELFVVPDVDGVFPTISKSFSAKPGKFAQSAQVIAKLK